MHRASFRVIKSGRHLASKLCFENIRATIPIIVVLLYSFPNKRRVKGLQSHKVEKLDLSGSVKPEVEFYFVNFTNAKLSPTYGLISMCDNVPR